MNKKILITGATGFIGRNILHQLNIKKYDISLLIRPETRKDRLSGFPEKAEILAVDLADIRSLKQVLSGKEFQVIIHVGAIRNRPRATEEDYRKANVQATEQLALQAMKNQAKFIFFSSLGIFGTVPSQLPAKETTARNGDNNYHSSKIQAEALIDRYVLYGLRSAVIRPAITYGPKDFGFPYHLIRLIDKKQIFLPAKAPLIHLANVELLVLAVQKLVENDFRPGSIYNIADRNPVNLLTLADFINQEIKGKPFSKRYIIPGIFFQSGYQISKLLGNQAWSSRFQLFSQDWYYDVESAYQELSLKNIETIPGIRSTIEWYKKLKKIRKH